MASKILVIDDSETTRLQMKVVLKSLSCDVVEAIDGLDGLDKIEKNQDLSMIFCDVNMPNLDGVAMVETLAKNSKAAGRPMPPVVMLTTESTAELVVRGRAAGVKGWLIKPPKPAKIIEIISKVLAK
jgi:two-component system chemotaxis response regulator CheY